MKRQIRITNLKDLDIFYRSLIASADKAKNKLLSLCESKSGIEVLYDMKFYQTGRDPIEDRDLNIIEQLNQQFTYLVSLNATKQLLKVHPGEAPFIMNLGTAPGPDIISENNVVSAEVFSSANPKNNDKLLNDAERVQKTDSKYKYVFYHSPTRHSREDWLSSQYPDVKIIYLENVDFCLDNN